MDKRDLKIEYIKSVGPGGQHVNKNHTTVRVTHMPTGTSVIQRGRYRHKNQKLAIKAIEQKISALKESICGAIKKAKRDYKIHNTKTIRTYNYARGVVVDHRTRKTASLKEVMDKGNIDLLRK